LQCEVNVELLGGDHDYQNDFNVLGRYLLDSGNPKMQYAVVIEEYPHNLIELEAAFSTEAACRDYLARLRWPDGFQCPHCGGGKSWPVRNVLIQCAACGYQTSVTAGTIFSGYADSVAGLVSGHVVGNDPEERRQRVGASASAGAEEP